MNKFFVLITFLFLVSCNDHNEAPQANRFDGIDKGISGIIIGDPETTLKLIDKSWIDSLAPLESLILSNKSKNQFVEIIHHPGDIRYSISEFKLTQSIPYERKYSQLDEVEVFKTHLGITLGMTMDNVQNILGKGKLFPDDDGNSMLEYQVDSKDSDFLKKVNMPKYYGKYYFHHNILIEIHWGLEQV